MCPWGNHLPSGDSIYAYHSLITVNPSVVHSVQIYLSALHSMTRFPLTWQERKVTMKLSNCWRKETIPVSYSMTVVRFNMLQCLVYIHVLYCDV